MEADLNDLLKPSENLRLKLLAEERKLRSKQPEAWTKTKYRKYANFGRSRLEQPEAVLAKAAVVKAK